MQIIRTKKGQSLIDISLQYYGSLDMLLQLALDNEIDLLEGSKIPTLIKIEESKIVDKRVVTFFEKGKIEIVTGV